MVATGIVGRPGRWGGTGHNSVVGVMNSHHPKYFRITKGLMVSLYMVKGW